MNVECRRCKKTYNDAVCWTFCPHDRFISDETAKRKDEAFSLLGKRVRFRGEMTGKSYRVQGIDHEGMIELEGLSGNFAPHLFLTD